MVSKNDDRDRPCKTHPYGLAMQAPDGEFKVVTWKRRLNQAHRFAQVMGLKQHQYGVLKLNFWQWTEDNKSGD